MAKTKDGISDEKDGSLKFFIEANYTGDETRVAGTSVSRLLVS